VVVVVHCGQGFGVLIGMWKRGEVLLSVSERKVRFYVA
jgi:hypothetical protein